MSFLILVRHGQSTWNLEKKFTGWVDVDLTDKGILEAKKAGSLLKNQNIKIDFYYTSLQLRANNTLKIIQQESCFFCLQYTFFGQININPTSKFFL